MTKTIDSENTVLTKVRMDRTEFREPVSPFPLVEGFANPHLAKPVGREGEYIAVANLNGTVIIVNANGQVVRFETDTYVNDLALLSANETAFIAFATPEAVKVLDFNWNNPPSDSVARCARRLEGHDGRVTAVTLFRDVSTPALSGLEDVNGLKLFVVSGDERGNIHRWGDRGLRYLGAVRAHRKTVHYAHASIARDGQQVFVTASDDRDVLVHRQNSEQLYARFNAHVGWVEQIVAVEFGGILEHLVVTDRVGTMVWDVEAQRVISRFRGRPRMDVAVYRDLNAGVIVAAGTDDGVSIACHSRLHHLQTAEPGMLRGLSLSNAGSLPVVWLGVNDRLCSYELDGDVCQRVYQFPANVLRLKAWKNGRRMLILLENGSVWMMKC
jgi:hypothetical protein